MDVWKENILEELEAEEIEYKLARKFLAGLKKEFGGGDEEVVKVAELKRIKQGERMIEEFIQEFKRAVRGSGYEGRPLVEEFKRGMSRVIRRKLIVSSSQMVDLVFLYFTFHFLFSFCFIFIFSILRTTRVRVNQSCSHISHNLMI